MNIAILGTGHVATTLAGAWSASGHTVTLGSRTPETKTLEFPVVSFAEAVASADVIVNATPGESSVATVTSIGSDAFDGKILVDAANAVISGENGLELAYPNSSLAEAIQAALPTAKVVKALNTAAMNVIVDPSQLPESSVFVSSDDEGAKTVVASLLADFGWKPEDIIDLGGLVSARGVEHYFPFFFALMQANKTPLFNIKVVR